MQSVYDRVHDESKLPGVVGELAVSKEVCRLDRVRQLGGCHFVYPSATHTRREHSIGVSHLAGECGLHLKRMFPHLVDDDDILCLRIAGLLHDVGHGPFSHAFEVFMQETGHHWCHERMSAAIAEKLLQNLSKNPFERGSLNQHIEFIKLIMSGSDHRHSWSETLTGRPEEKRFLASIVHNRDSGMDVDKYDYLLRDSLAVLGASKTLDVTRLICAMRVVNLNGANTLGFDESAAFDVSEVYALRSRMHCKLYQHHDVVFCERMLVELMKRVDSQCDGSLSRRATTIEGLDGLTDDFVLSLSPVNEPNAIPDFRCLFQWARAQHTPSTILLKTLPSCVFCKEETPISALFCPACGGSTKDRTGTMVNDMLVAKECLIDPASVSRYMNETLERTDIVVSIVDVCCGSQVKVIDAHGKAWRMFDPLQKVLFTSPNGPITRLESHAHLVPDQRHLRSARCYVNNEVSTDEILRIDAAFASWGKDCGLIVQSTE